MKSTLIWSVFLLPVIVVSGCRSKEKKADVPDVQIILRNISYLDSLLQCKRVDSISIANAQLSATLEVHAGQAQSPNEKAILDSLSKISTAVNEFVRFCTDSRINLEMLQQDVTSVESGYKSGNIKLGYYISSLLESEQIETDINNRYFNGLANSLRYLHNQSLLIGRLTVLDAPEQ